MSDRQSNNGSRQHHHFPDDISEASSNALSRQESITSFVSSRAATSGSVPLTPRFSSSMNGDMNSSLMVDVSGRGGTSQSRTPAPSIKSNNSFVKSTTKKGPSNQIASKDNKQSSAQLPHHKAGRVKVGIRCRPAFQDELDFARGNFFSIVDCKPSDTEQSALGRVSLTLLSGKQRDFMYDYTFDSHATQDYVYDKIARPVVTDVLRGFNGTIFAYGQTGTGKTYTMGILEFVNNEHAGIIPRSIAQIFDYIHDSSEKCDIVVSLSFLQLYRETIQDLLGPVNGGQVGDDNLAIREDPSRGFYVEGLQEFIIRNYSEAEALLNLGLENRAIAPTLMNATSSRSHTVLTLNIEQRGLSGGQEQGLSYARTVRSKLLMVDLAGSERVRRTVSKGTRLSEAKSINTSLSALGNVIAALAETKSPPSHIPYRDSKLTRLLQDSLGGTASTALIATVGPAPVNYGETLSTLTFASRCMAVKTTPVQHEEVDYAELCAQLQEKVSTMEGTMTAKMIEQQEKFEAEIGALQEQLEQQKTLVGATGPTSKGDQTLDPAAGLSSFDNPGLTLIFDHISSIATSIVSSNDLTGPGSQKDWVSKLMASIGDNAYLLENFQLLLSLLAYCYELIAAMCFDTTLILRNNSERESSREEKLKELLGNEKDINRIREIETQQMEQVDPLASVLATRNVKIGSHLSFLNPSDAIQRVEQRYKSNNDLPLPFSYDDLNNKLNDIDKLPFINHLAADELVHSFTELHRAVIENIGIVAAFMNTKDRYYDTIKLELADQLVERRKREEEVINWSYILKYLLQNSSKLKKQLREEKNFHGVSNGGNSGGPQPVNTLDIQRMMEQGRQGYTNKRGDNRPQISRLYNRVSKSDEALAFNERTRNQSFDGRIRQSSTDEDDDDEYDQLGDDDDFEATKSIADSDIASTNLSFQSAATVQSIPLKVKHPPSLFAQQVVQELSVEGENAVAAMKVIDEVSKISPEQLQALDPATRAQILQIRKELGINDKSKQAATPSTSFYHGGNSNRPTPSSTQLGVPTRMRSASAPKMRAPAATVSNESNASNRSGMITPRVLATPVQHGSESAMQSGYSDHNSESSRARLMAEAKRIQRNAGTTPAAARFQQQQAPNNFGNNGQNTSNKVSRDRQFATPDVNGSNNVTPVMRNIHINRPSTINHISGSNSRGQRDNNYDDDDFSQLDDIDGDW